MKALEIFLKSGASFTVDATEVTTTRYRTTGDLTKIEWITPDGATRRLHTIALSEVAALVVIS